MNLVGQKVKHSAFGTGTVTKQDDVGHITVEFPNKISIFQYPMAFEKFLEAEDDNLQAEILSELNVKKQEIAEEKAAIVTKWKEKALSSYGVIASDYDDKKYVPVKRTEGIPLTFLVFQGGIFDVQAKEQYIWAPIYNAAGDHLFYWDNITNIREGDIIIHADGGYIKAVSRAKGSWYSFDNPYDIFDNPIYKDGRRVDLEVTLINNPVCTSDFRDEIIQYCNVKYAPFDKNANGNRGYLYDIDNKLVSVFLKETAKNNNEIAELDYIQWLL